MSRRAARYVVGLLLVFAVASTGMTGLIQAKLDLHGFVPHRYFAYSTIFLAFVHVLLNFRNITRYLKSKITKGGP